VNIKKILDQIHRGDLDIKLQTMQDQRTALTKSEEYFEKLVTACSESHKGERGQHVEMFEWKLTEAIYQMMQTLVTQTSQEIENVLKRAVIKSKQ
jgi:hypothetical protein